MDEFDEPLSNVDESTKEILIDEILKRTENKILILTLHGNEKFYDRFNKIVNLNYKKMEVIK